MTRSPKVPAWRVDFALAAVVCIWSLNFVLLKAVLPRFDPLALAATRFVCVGVLFELLLRRRGAPEAMAREDRGAFVASALLGYTLYQGAFILALHHSTVFSTALMINTGPVWAGVALWLTGAERVGARRWRGFLLALAGLLVYVGPQVLAGTTAGTGDLLALGAAVSWALYGIRNKRLLERYSALYVTTRTFQIGALLFLPFAVPAVLRQHWAGVGLGGWGAVAFSVVFPITLAVTLWNWAIGQQGVGRTAVYQYLVPVVSGVLSWLVLAEGFGSRKLAGGVLILLGVALSRGR
ncbi:MAG: DMT family transporter [Deferrisomatales bacterium]|nr:DMT family transporter [Deferrisomatales bacterium]